MTAIAACAGSISSLRGELELEIPKGAKAPKADFSAFNNQSVFNDENIEIEDGQDKSKPKFSPEELEKMAVLKVKGSYNITSIAKILNEDPVRLKRWNPEFDKEIGTALTPIHLRIPVDKLEQFIILKDKIITESKKVY